MRNLKRALSLTLASVMLLGMMVVGSSALSFNDADDITNVTAASVLEDLGIMQGDGSGNFMPDRPVTRAQMAIIVCRILYGNKLNVSQFEGTTQYTDVGANDYYTGYINLATQLGIIGGYGDGRFGPNDTVTTAQAALMLSRALGYFKGNEIAQASDWALASIAQATKIKMFGDLNLATNAELARDNVAEMVFNTITKTVPVQYNELLGVYYNENKGIIYALTFYYTDTLGYKNFGLVYRSNDTTDYGRPGTTWGTGSYRLASTGEGATGSDQYGLNEDGSLKPERVKMLSQDEIITVAYEPDFVYTGNTKQDKVYKDLGSSLCKTSSSYDWSYYVDGDLKNGYTTRPVDEDENWTMGAGIAQRFSGNGATTEIYIDSVNETVRVVTIWNYMAEVLREREDSDGRYIDVRVGECEYSVDTDYHTDAFAADDFIIVNIDNENRETASNSGDYFIQDAYETEKVEGTVREVRKWIDSDGGNDGDWVRLEDTERHTYSLLTWSDVDDINTNHPDLDAEYRLYQDPNGYVVGFQALEDISRNYLYVKDTHDNMGVQAKVVFADGTSARIDVDDEFTNYKAASYTGYGENNVTTWGKNDIPASATNATNKVYENYLMGQTEADADNHLIGVDSGDQGKTDERVNQRVFRYGKDKNNLYTLTQLSDKRAQLLFSQDKNGDNGDKSIVNGAAYITVETATQGTSRYIVDQKTAFVDVEDETLYTGYDEVPNYLDASFYVVDVRNDRVADVVFIISGERYNDNSTYFYVTDNRPFSTYKDDKYGYDVSLFPAKNTFVDGKAQDVEVDYEKCILTGDFDGIGLYKIVRENDDGVATEIQKVDLWNAYAGQDKDEGHKAIASTATGLYTDAYLYDTDGSDKVGTVKPADSQWVVNSDTVFVIISGDKMDKVAVVTGSAGARYIIDDKDIDLNNNTDRTYVTVIKSDGDKNIAELVYVVEYELTSDLSLSFTGMTASGYYVNGKSAANLNGLKAGDKIEFTLTAQPGYDLPATIQINGTNVPVDPATGKVSYTVPSDGVVAIPDTPAEPQSATLKIGTTTNGSVAVTGLTDGAEIKVGDELTIVATPDRGYEVGTVTVKVGSKTTTITADATTGAYTYTVVAADVGKEVTAGATFVATTNDTSITVNVNAANEDITVAGKVIDGTDLKITLTLPENATLKTDAVNVTVTAADGKKYAVSATPTDAGLITVSVDGINTDGDVTVDLPALTLAGYAVTFDDSAVAGWDVIYDTDGTNTSKTLSTTAEADLKVKLAAGANVSKVKVNFTITGIGANPVAKEVASANVENGYVQINAITGGNVAATGPVTVKITAITPIEASIAVDATLKGDGVAIKGLSGYSKVVAEESNKVIVTADKTTVNLTSTDAGAKDVTFTVKLGTNQWGTKEIADWGVKEYTFVITIDGTEYKATPTVTDPASPNSTAGWYPIPAEVTFKVVGVSENISIKASDIKVEMKERPVAVSGVYDATAKTITLTYDKDITGTRNYTNSKIDVVASGKTMVWTYKDTTAADPAEADAWIEPSYFKGADGTMIAWQGFKVEENGSVTIFPKTMD